MHLVPPMPGSDEMEQVTDSMWLGHAAAEAHKCGRHTLGVELGRLAHRAAVTERMVASKGPARDVPLLGATRDEWPRPTNDLFPENRSHAPTTCAAVLEDNGSRGLCNVPIRWIHGWVGDDKVAPIMAGWAHVDPEVTDHAPVPAP